MAVYITDKYLIHQAVLHTECHTTSWELLGLPEYLLLKASACISYVTGYWQWSSVNRGESILTVFHLVQVLIQSGVKGTLSSRWRTLSLILYTSTYPRKPRASLRIASIVYDIAFLVQKLQAYKSKIYTCTGTHSIGFSVLYSYC